MRVLRTFTALAAAALLGGVLACDSSNPVAPPGTVLTLTASPTQIGLSGSASITVTGFRPDGNPLNPGTQLHVTTTLGVVQPTVIEIGDSGRGTATLTGDGRSGTATVTVRTAGADAEASVDVQIGQTTDSKPTLTITASPEVVALGETSTISVVARRADGSLLGAGGQVRLRTSLGSLDDESLVTDANSEASTTFRAGDQDGTATITGSVDSSDEVTISVTIENQKANLIINANPSVLDVNEAAEISILARDQNNVPLGRGETILLTADLGTLHATDDADSAEIDSIKTDRDGRAVFFYIAGPRAGTGEVTAILGNSDPATASITIRDAAADFTFLTNKNTVDNNGDSLTLIVTVVNGEGQPLGGELVRFDLSAGVSGTFDPAGGAVTTDNQGEARATVTFAAEGLPDVGETFDVIARVGILDPKRVTITVQ